MGARMGHTSGRCTSNIRGAVMKVGDTATCAWPNGHIRVGTVTNLHRSVIAFDFADELGLSTYVTYLHNEGVEWIFGVATPAQAGALRVACALRVA